MQLLQTLALLFVLPIIPIKNFAQIKDNRVVIIDKQYPSPEAEQRIGTIHLSDNGFKMHCGYNDVIAEAKEEALKKGANLVKLTKVREPNSLTTCYRIKAILYHTDSLEKWQALYNEKDRKITDSLMPSGSKYALLFIFTPADAHSLYNLHMDDTLIKNNTGGTYFTVRLYKEGDVRIWTKLFSRKEVTLNVKFGEVYFLCCTQSSWGGILGEPIFSFTEKQQGMKEIYKLKAYHEKSYTMYGR